MGTIQLQLSRWHILGCQSLHSRCTPPSAIAAPRSSIYEPRVYTNSLQYLNYRVSSKGLMWSNHCSRFYSTTLHLQIESHSKQDPVPRMLTPPHPRKIFARLGAQWICHLTHVGDGAFSIFRDDSSRKLASVVG